MAKLLKGNYKLSKAPTTTGAKKPKESLTEQFEQGALAKLGGSIAFVMKDNTFMWKGDSPEDEKASG